MFFPQDFDQTRSSRLQRRNHILQDNHIFSFIVEIAEGCKHAEHQSEGVCAHEIAHIFLDPLNLGTYGAGFRSRLVQEVLRSVHSSDRESSLCKGNAASSRTAAEVEDGLASGLG